MRLKQHFMIIVFGSTATGKSDFAVRLAQQIPAQIVNCDIGQFYTPFGIGTAKPDWKSESIKHHLFDIIDKPEYFDVCRYRSLLLDCCETIWADGDIPILVGGSGFYLKSLLFPPLSAQKNIMHSCDAQQHDDESCLWENLYAIDPLRASHINESDIYRIKRALDIWRNTGIKPSVQIPKADFPCSFFFFCLQRDRQELYDRINKRTLHMLENGWIDEVERLMETPWKTFFKEKKLIGYDDIVAYLQEDGTYKNAQDVATVIQQKTRHYAKRQITFWKMLKKLLQKEVDALQSNERQFIVQPKVASIDLTLLDLDLYIKQLINDIKPLYE